MSNTPPKRTPRENLTVTSDRTQVGDMEFKVASIVTYIPIVSIVMSIAFLRTEPKTNYLLRFHAMQSLLFSGAYAALSIVCGLLTSALGWIPFINVLAVMVGGIGWGLATAVYFLGSIFLMMKAQTGDEYKIPMLGDYAEQYMQQNQNQS